MYLIWTIKIGSSTVFFSGKHESPKQGFLGQVSEMS